MFKDAALQVLKATLAAIVFSLVFVLVFTLIIHLASLSANVIMPVNQVFKTIAVATGCLLFIKGEKGYLKGAVAGLFSIVLSYLLFSAIGGSFSIKWTFALELLLGVASGAIAGIIAVTLKKA